MYQLLKTQLQIVQQLQDSLLKSLERGQGNDLYSDRLSEYSKAIESAANALKALREVQS